MGKSYTPGELSSFCLQLSLLLSAAVELEEGLSMMAEDAADQEERVLLQFLSEQAGMGEPLDVALDRAGAFPRYVVRMAKLGQQTGTLDQMMESLAAYYEKEWELRQSIKNALTYPVIMTVMLLTVLFVLFTKVMPVFEGIYEQLGAQLSPVSRSAIRLGGMLSGAALLVTGLLAIVACSVYAASLFGRRFDVIERMADRMKRKNRIALAAARRRLAAVLALTARCGIELEKGMGLAEELVENSQVREQIQACTAELESGTGPYGAMKKTGLFRGFHLQMIQVGVRSGRLDIVMEEIAKAYGQEADAAMDDMIARLEPAMVAVLAVSVGMVLLSVILPLAGVLAAIG